MKNVETILQQFDMERTRTPSELYNWVNAKAEELCQSLEGKQYARSGASLPKKLWEEVRPFGLFAYYRYGLRSDVRCTPNLGNENFEGKIDFVDGSIPSIFVEITYAKDGHDESLRFEVLSQEGLVNWLGPISKSGTKASGPRKVHVENEFVDHEVTRKRALEIVQERLIKKSQKSYELNHELVVVVDDYLPFRTEEDRKILEEYAKAAIGGANLDFGKVFLLGSSGNYLFQIHGNT